MRLKALTTLVIVLGTALLLGWPFVLRMRPKVVNGKLPPVTLSRLYVVTFGGYIGATLFSFMTAGVLSVIIIRQAREEFQQMAIENMRGLVEGSLEDLKTRGNPKSNG